jgi:hypothetical protein
MMRSLLRHVKRAGESDSVIEPPADSVERQVRAYNDHNIEEFVACYARAVVIEDADGSVLVRGREEMREHYGRIFDRLPDLHAEIVSRIRVGSYVVDEEHVTGRLNEDLRAVAIYHLDEDGLIDHVRFLR